MTPEEHDLIAALFDRLQASDTQPHDHGAEQFIQRQIQAQPGAPYLLTQTVLLQEQALANAQARIAQLEARLKSPPESPRESSRKSFLRAQNTGPASSGAASPPFVQLPAESSAPPRLPLRAAPAAGEVGGGFLRGALATAAGVTGGALLFQGIQNLLGQRAGPFAPALASFQTASAPHPVLAPDAELTNDYSEAPGFGEPSGFLDDPLQPGGDEFGDSTGFDPDFEGYDAGGDDMLV